MSRQYRTIRALTERLCQPLVVEDYGVQAMPDVSPPKWHLAHTTWFFETFILRPYEPHYRPFRAQFEYLFNSYYEGVGPRHPRPERGLLSRPTTEEVYAYRAYVDEAMRRLTERFEASGLEEAEALVVLGLHHEQQHQELLLTDLKYNFAANPLRPAYRQVAQLAPGDLSPPSPLEWWNGEGGVRQIGYGGGGFAFDNERPPHSVYLASYRLASRLTTNGEFQD